MEAACEQAKRMAGGPGALAKAIGGISPQAVSQWKIVPIARVNDVAAAVGMRASELRPDIFGASTDA